MTGRVLVVEDDHGLRDVLVRGLREAGFTVESAVDGATALRLVDPSVAAVVLDIGLPDADGRDVCQAMRARGINSPVIFLTALDRTVDRLSGFAAGGDDYLGKPFSLAELVARLRVAVRRVPVAAPSSQHPVTVDPARLTMSHNDVVVKLTPTEFKLVATLLAAHGAIVNRDALVRSAWPEGAYVAQNTLDQYIARLRRKLKEIESPLTLTTTHGVGYELA